MTKDLIKLVEFKVSKIGGYTEKNFEIYSKNPMKFVNGHCKSSTDNEIRMTQFGWGYFYMPIKIEFYETLNQEPRNI